MDRVKSPTCFHCETYLSIYKPYVMTQKDCTRFMYIAGWRNLEINGGEPTDDWICPACDERITNAYAKKVS